MAVSAAGAKKQYNANLSLQLAHQSNIRTKYSSGSDSANQDEYSQDEAGAASVIAVELHEAPDEQIEGAGIHRRYFPQSMPLNSYSTSSQSEGEEGGGVAVSNAHDSDQEELQRHSRFRSSAASGSSTLTLRSVSSSVLRRNRVRSSAVSIRSSASDRTLKGSNESLSMVGVQEDKGKFVKEPPPAPPVRTVSQVVTTTTTSPHQHESDSSLTSLTSTEINASDSSVKNVTLDPTAIAQKVLAETHIEREALEKMQRLSLRGQFKFRQANQNVTKAPDASQVNLKVSPPANHPKITSTSLPHCNISRNVHDDIAETHLGKINLETSPTIPISPITMSSSETDFTLKDSDSLTPTMSYSVSSLSTDQSAVTTPTTFTDQAQSVSDLHTSGVNVNASHFMQSPASSFVPFSHSSSSSDNHPISSQDEMTNRTIAAPYHDSGVSSMPTTNCSSSSNGNSSFDSTGSGHHNHHHHPPSNKDRPPVPAKPKSMKPQVRTSVFKPAGQQETSFSVRASVSDGTHPRVSISGSEVDSVSTRTRPAALMSSMVRLTRHVTSNGQQASPRSSYHNVPPELESSQAGGIRLSSSSEDSHLSAELSSLNDSGGGKAQSPSLEMRSFQPYNSKYQHYSNQRLFRKLESLADSSAQRTQPLCDPTEKSRAFPGEIHDSKTHPPTGQSVLVARIAPNRTNVPASTDRASPHSSQARQGYIVEGERRFIPKDMVLHSSKC